MIISRCLEIACGAHILNIITELNFSVHVIASFKVTLLYFKKQLISYILRYEVSSRVSRTFVALIFEGYPFVVIENELWNPTGNMEEWKRSLYPVIIK